MKAIDNIKAMQLSELEERLLIMYVNDLSALQNDFAATINYCDENLYTDYKLSKFNEDQKRQNFGRNPLFKYRMNIPQNAVAAVSAANYRQHLIAALYDEREYFNYTYNWLAAIYNHEHGAEIYKLIDPDKQRPQQSETTAKVNNTNSALYSTKAKIIYQKAIDAGYMTIKDGYKLNDLHFNWKLKPVLLSYFADKMSKYLELSTTKVGSGKKSVYNISWQPFETMFGIKHLQQKKANWKYTNRYKYRESDIFKPKDYDKIDSLFKE
jgi:hypothetical protein